MYHILSVTCRYKADPTSIFDEWEHTEQVKLPTDWKGETRTWYDTQHPASNYVTLTLLEINSAFYGRLLYDPEKLHAPGDYQGGVEE